MNPIDIARAGAALVERVYGWRSMAWGPPTAEFTSTVMARTYVQWRQVGISLRWDPDEDSHHLHLRVGPLGANFTIGRREVRPMPDEPARYRTYRLRELRELHLYLVRRHVGAVADWTRFHGRLAVRVEVGPLGVLVEPTPPF